MRKRLRESYLDGEKLFRQYFAMGNGTSASRLQKFAVTSGMVSSDGTEPTRMGVWKAMWRWASLKENKDVAFEIFRDHLENFGWDWGDPELPWDGDYTELWRRFMLQKIRSAWQYDKESKYQRFLRENGWL